MKKVTAKTLFVCNSVYQVLVALWIAYRIQNFKEVDFIITDRMNDGHQIAQRVKQLLDFDCNAFYSETKDFCRDKRIQPRFSSPFPQLILNKMIRIESEYKRVYLANVDKFSQLLINSLGHLQKVKPEIILFEDGINTYSKQMEEMYNQSGHNLEPFSLLATKLFGAYQIKGHIKYALLFCPELMQWHQIESIELEKINPHDHVFLRLLNYVFDYHNEADIYDTKYIFIEESYFTSGKSIQDIELVDGIAQIVGKENIMVKIHPRNPINRFERLGYKTNSNTSIPWELIVMNNQHILDKTLITIGSSSVFNPKLIFGLKVNVISLIDVIVEEDRKKLNSYLWDLIAAYMTGFPDEYRLVSSINNII